MAYRGDRPYSRRNKRRWIVFAASLLVIAAAAGLYLRPKSQSPAAAQPIVPADIAAKVSFPVYYPDPKKLPAGYTLDRSSFGSPVKNGVNYKVSYGNGKSLVFSIQMKPSDSQLQTFNSSYIPLRIDYQTSAGQAEIGAYNNHGTIETLVSLPTPTNAWIIITGPQDTDQTNLKQVLKALRQ